jgi:hypothetical protein
MDHTGRSALVDILTDSLMISVAVSGTVTGAAAGIDTILITMVISMIITSVIAVIVPMPVTVTVSGRSPPGGIIIVVIRPLVISVTHPTIAYANRESPSGKGIVMNTKAISYRSRIVIPAIPGPVMVTRPIHNGTPIGI